MRIRINLQIFLFIVVFIFTKQIELYTVFMFFAFIHELAHLFTGIILGLKPKKLSIMPFGITVNFESYEKNIELKKIIIALAGPALNGIIALIVIALEGQENIIYANFLMMLFNLIPIYPLDGGRILRSILRVKTKALEADILVNRISNILLIAITCLGSILILYIHNLAIAFIILYLWMIIIKENKDIKIKIKINEIINKKY